MKTRNGKAEVSCDPNKSEHAFAIKSASKLNKNLVQNNLITMLKQLKKKYVGCLKKCHPTGNPFNYTSPKIRDFALLLCFSYRDPQLNSGGHGSLCHLPTIFTFVAEDSEY